MNQGVDKLDEDSRSSGGGRPKAHPDEESVRLMFDWIDSGVKQVFSSVQQFFQPALRLGDIPAALALLNAYLPREVWELCFSSCLVRLPKSDVESLISHKAARLITQLVSRHAKQP